MKLSRDSLVIRWAYWAEEEKPKSTTLCALFWRGLVAMPIITLFYGAVCIALSPVFLCEWLSGKLYFKRLKGSLKKRWERSAARRTLSVIKQKLCPRIQLWCPSDSVSKHN